MSEELMSNQVRIGDRAIGHGAPLYVIAEMACAHDGEVAKARKLIDAAVAAEADAVQLQFLSADSLVTPDHEVYELLTQIEFSSKQWEDLWSYARGFDIHVFVCTYDMPSVELALKLGADGIKVNSSDLSNPDLLAMVAGSGIPFTLGTGASTIEEIARAIEFLLQHGGDQIILMHGIQNFPTDVRDAHINRMKILSSRFPFPAGYQDHTDASEPFSRIIDLLAIGAGAAVIEKHATLDRSEKGTDYQAALEPGELKQFVEMVRMAEIAMGPERILPLDESAKAYRQFQKKSIVAIRDMTKGEEVRREDIAFLRSSETGLQPTDVDLVLGKRLARSVARHQIILPECLIK